MIQRSPYQTLGIYAMSHSHMPIQHLLKQLEAFSSKRESRDIRPEWVTEFIGEVAELFEPLTGVGRVGFDCQFSEDCWVVGMYLGKTEMVGGKCDGHSVNMNFDFNLLGLLNRFCSVQDLKWSAHPTGDEGDSLPARSFITITGLVGENLLRLQIFSTPPETTGPGLRQYPNGEYEPC